MPWIQPGDLVIFYSAGNLRFMLGCVEKRRADGLYTISKSGSGFISFWHVTERDIIFKIESRG